MTDEIITREQLLESLVTAAYTGDAKDGTMEQLRRWIGVDLDIIDESVVLAAMDELEIENRDERIEWYNQATLSIKDVLYLCNIKFDILKAACCDKVEYLGPDHHRFLNIKNDLWAFRGVIGGTSVDVLVCEEHWPKWLK